MKTTKNKPKVALGLSGGVDSAVSAALLQEQGYEIHAVYLECWRAPGCRTDADRKDALDVALHLGIPYTVLDFKQEYKDRVVEYFYQEYQAGRTPNPDTMCNREIKFGMFYDWAMKEGFDFVATGHYARIALKEGILRLSGGANSATSDQDNKLDLESLSSLSSDYLLAQGVDSNKDQSYFLYQLRPEQLEHILFPIGHLTKPEVRSEAQARNLPVAAKKDSVGICFIGDINVRKFLEERITPKKGEVVDTKGKVIGEHEGVWFYTIGQRHGFRLNAKAKSDNSDFKHAIPPLYVIDKDVKHNRLVVGYGAETYTSVFQVEDLNWLISNFELSGLNSPELRVRIRHRGKLLSATVTAQDTGLQVTLNEPQRGVAEGQAAVFYLGEIVLGGGIIAQSDII